MPVLTLTATRSSGQPFQLRWLLWAGGLLAVALFFAAAWAVLQTGAQIRLEGTTAWGYNTNESIQQVDPYPGAEPVSWTEDARAVQVGPLALVWPVSLQSGARRGAQLRALRRQAKAELLDRLDSVAATATCDRVLHLSSRMNFPVGKYEAFQLRNRASAARGNYKEAIAGVQFMVVFTAFAGGQSTPDHRSLVRSGAWNQLTGSAPQEIDI